MCQFILVKLIHFYQILKLMPLMRFLTSAILLFEEEWLSWGSYTH